MGNHTLVLPGEGYVVGTMWGVMVAATLAAVHATRRSTIIAATAAGASAAYYAGWCVVIALSLWRWRLVQSVLGSSASQPHAMSALLCLSVAVTIATGAKMQLSYAMMRPLNVTVGFFVMATAVLCALEARRMAGYVASATLALAGAWILYVNSSWVILRPDKHGLSGVDMCSGTGMYADCGMEMATGYMTVLPERDKCSDEFLVKLFESVKTFADYCSAGSGSGLASAGHALQIMSDLGQLLRKSKDTLTGQAFQGMTQAVIEAASSHLEEDKPPETAHQTISSSVILNRGRLYHSDTQLIKTIDDAKLFTTAITEENLLVFEEVIRSDANSTDPQKKTRNLIAAFVYESMMQADEQAHNPAAPESQSSRRAGFARQVIGLLRTALNDGSTSQWNNLQ